MGQRAGRQAPGTWAPNGSKRNWELQLPPKCSRMGFGPLSNPTLSIHSGSILSSASFWALFVGAGVVVDKPSPFALDAPGFSTESPAIQETTLSLANPLSLSSDIARFGAGAAATEAKQMLVL